MGLPLDEKDQESAEPSPEKRLTSMLLRDVFAALVAYGVSIVLDLILLRPPREILATSPILSIDRPGGISRTLGYYAAAAILVLLLWWSIDNLQLSRRWLWKSASVLLVLSLFFGYASAVLIPRVGAKTPISGEATTSDLFCYLFVRPLDSSLCWLQSPVPLVLDSQGNWRTGAWFSGAPGQYFELFLVGTPQRLHPDPFDLPGKYSCRNIPAAHPRAARLVVLR